MLLIEWLACRTPGHPSRKTSEAARSAIPRARGAQNIQELLYIFGRDLEKDAIIDIGVLPCRSDLLQDVLGDLFPEILVFLAHGCGNS